MNTQEYLNKKIKPIFEALIPQLCNDKPENPIRYMIDYFTKKIGYNKKNLNQNEKEELDHLRAEFEKLYPIEPNEKENAPSEAIKSDSLSASDSLNSGSNSDSISQSN